MKKFLVSLLLLVAMMLNIVAMTACNGGGDIDINDAMDRVDSAGYAVPENGYDGSEVTITFYHTMSATALQPTLDLYIEDFNKLYPNIHIEHKQVGGYDDVVDQIKTELTAGNQPNIAYCYPDHVALYNKARAVVPLDNFINSTITVTDNKGQTSILGLTDEQKADFIKGYYDEGAVYDQRGTMYTLPLSKSTEALYYNKTFFEVCQRIYTEDYEIDMRGNYVLDAEGNKKPNPNKGNEDYNITVPTTWDEMEAVCRKILKIDPLCIPLGYDSESNWFITMCEQMNSGYTTLNKNNYFTFDNAKNRAFVERFANWYKEGLVTTQELYGAYTSELFKTTDAAKQKCYMVIGSTGGANHQVPPQDGNGNYIFEAGMTTIPQIDASNPKVISQGPSLCIFKDTNPQEVVASWLFVKYLTTTPEFQAQFSMMSGYAPVIKSAQENKTYQDWLATANGYGNLAAASVKLALDQEKAYYVSPAFVGSSDARNQVGLIIQNVFAGAKAGTDTLKNVIDAEFKRAMAECKYAVGQ